MNFRGNLLYFSTNVKDNITITQAEENYKSKYIELYSEFIRSGKIYEAQNEDPRVRKNHSFS